MGKGLFFEVRVSIQYLDYSVLKMYTCNKTKLNCVFLNKGEVSEAET